jgi:DNA-binding MarR family transcriptional regulator
MYDVLATLRRASPDGQLTAGDLVRETMVTTGAMTKRIDGLAARGLVERVATTDRRVVLVRLTAAGRELVDEVIEHHVAFEEALLSPLSPRQRRDVAARLRSLLLALESDRP